MKQQVELLVPIGADWDAGDGVQVFTDFGTGTIDQNQPLTVRRADVLPGRQPGKGVGQTPVGAARVGDARATRPKRGIGATRVGKQAVGTATRFARVLVETPAAFGRWKFAMKTQGREGNVQTAPLLEATVLVSATSPAPLKSFALDNYNPATDQATFSFAVDGE